MISNGYNNLLVTLRGFLTRNHSSQVPYQTDTDGYAKIFRLSTHGDLSQSTTTTIIGYVSLRIARIENYHGMWVNEFKWKVVQ